MTKPMSTERVLRDVFENIPIFKYIVSFAPNVRFNPSDTLNKYSFGVVSHGANKRLENLITRSDIEQPASSSTLIFSNEQGIDDFARWILENANLGDYYDVTIFQTSNAKITNIRCYKNSNIDREATEGMITSIMGVSSELLLPSLFQSLP